MEPDMSQGWDEQNPHEALLLRLAVTAQEHIRDYPDHEYQLGIRDACLTVVALTVTKGTGRDAERLRHQLTNAALDGAEAPQLLQLALRAGGRVGGRPGLDWVGPRTFKARHGVGGAEEDLATALGPNRSIRLAWRRDAGRHVGMLYAHDRLWDEYAVIAASVDRDLAREACSRTLPTPGPEL